MMHRLAVTLSALLLIAVTSVEVTAASDGRPNVVLIMTDDQGYGDLSITGNQVVKTPNMDRLATEGLWLKKFYVSPVCTPTRAHLMTGRYGYRTRAIDTWLGRASMEPAEVTVAEVLSDAGYATGIFGKWHLGDYYPTRAMDQGFQESVVHKGGGLRQPSNPPDGERYHDPILYHNGQPDRYEGYCTDIFFDEAIRFIEQEAKAKKPFFAYVPTNAPHSPFDEPPSRKLMEHFTAKCADDGNTRRAGFYAMIRNIDDNIGRLLSKLEALDIEQRTLVVFLTDNGPAGGGSSGPFRGGKASVYEGGIRTVCFLRWPGVIEAGSTSSLMAAHIDLMPTILDVCNVPQPEGVKLDGRSLRPLFAAGDTAQEQEWPDRHICLQWHRGDIPQRYHHFAVVGPHGRWKLLSSSTASQPRPEKPPEFELYDLENDLSEKNDLADRHPEVVARLKRQYDAWFDDVCTTREPNFGMPPIVIGSKEQRTVVLTPQDKRVDSGERGGWWRAGHWPVSIHSEGPYTIEVLLNGKARQETTVQLSVEFGEDMFKARLKIPRGVDSAAIGDVVLPSGGIGRVVARVEDPERRGPRVYQVTIQ